MAASVATVLDAATVKRDGATTNAQPLPDTASTGAAMSLTSSTEAQRDPAAETKQFTPVETTSSEGTETEATSEATETTALVINTTAPPATEPGGALPPMKKTTPSSARAKSAKNALGISGPRKKSKKKAPAVASHPSVGVSVDALDKKKMWGNGRIIEVNVEEQRLKITFPGFSKSWDIWTDMLSIAPHCTLSKYPRTNTRSWDGKTNLFTGERIVKEDAEVCESPERVKQSPHDDVVLAPLKSPVRKPRKGYVLVPILETDVTSTSSTPSSTKSRPTSAALKRQAVQSGERPPKKKARSVKREPRPSVPPPIAREPYTDPELTRQRTENASALDKSAAFLSQCAALWKRQFGAMTDVERNALLSGTTVVNVAPSEPSVVM